MFDTFPRGYLFVFLSVEGDGFGLFSIYLYVFVFILVVCCICRTLSCIFLFFLHQHSSTVSKTLQNSVNINRSPGFLCDTNNMWVYEYMMCVYVCVCVPCSLLGTGLVQPQAVCMCARPIPSSPVQAAKAPVPRAASRCHMAAPTGTRTGQDLLPNGCF